MAKPSLKTEARREKFRKIGAAISKIGDPDVSDYTTGRASSFAMKRSDKRNRDGQEAEGRGTEVPFGPAFKTPQWERTARK